MNVATWPENIVSTGLRNLKNNQARLQAQIDNLIDQKRFEHEIILMIERDISKDT